MDLQSLPALHHATPRMGTVILAIQFAHPVPDPTKATKTNVGLSGGKYTFGGFTSKRFLHSDDLSITEKVGHIVLAAKGGPTVKVPVNQVTWRHDGSEDEQKIIEAAAREARKGKKANKARPAEGPVRDTAPVRTRRKQKKDSSVQSESRKVVRSRVRPPKDGT